MGAQQESGDPGNVGANEWPTLGTCGMEVAVGESMKSKKNPGAYSR